MGKETGKQLTRQEAEHVMGSEKLWGFSPKDTHWKVKSQQVTGTRERDAENHRVWDGPGRTGGILEVEMPQEGGPDGRNSSGKGSAAGKYKTF